MSARIPGPLQGTAYSLVRLLGAGGSGEVFEANHDALGTRVAIKLLRPDLARDPLQLDRLRAEARMLARISHPSLVGVFDLGVAADGRTFFAMEYVEGETAAALVSRRGPLPVAMAMELMAEVLDGLGAAHALGIVHCDVKPSNVIVGRDGKARVVDFGMLEGATQHEHGSGSPKGLVGTPRYMAPEQILAQRVSPATDVYAAACTLFSLLTGAPPFEGDVFEQHVNAPPPTLAERGRGEASLELEALIAQALAKDPHDRPPSAEAMAADLRRIAHPSQTTLVPPAARPQRANIRELPTAFVGRTHKLATIAELFARGDRLVTLVGPGGAGKTRLAQRYAALHVTDYAEAGGVWFVDLEEARTLGDVVTKVDRAIGSELPGGRDEAAALEQLGRYLRAQKSILLVLDNCEQATAEVAEVVLCWLEAAPGVRFLATSRERLGLEAELSYDVAPLSTREAIELFVDRARRVRMDFALGAEEARHVKAIVQALDGIPLAIELAAARIGIMSPATLRERLRERFELLSSPTRDAHPRQRTLRAAIAWSWNLLEPWEQAALAQCTVFSGGFTLEAAEAVLDLSAFPDAPSVLDVVQRLRDKSLLYAQSSREFPSEIRLGLYEMVRDYARDELALETLFERHAEYFLDAGSAWAERARAVGSPEHLRRLTLEVENVRAIHARYLGKNPRHVLRAGNILVVVLVLRDAPLNMLLEIADATIANAGDAEPELVADILYQRAHLWMRSGMAEEARADAEALRALADRRENPVIEVQARIACGNFVTMEERLEHAEAGVRAARQVGGAWLRRALADLASAQMDAGQRDLARGMSRELIALSDEADDPRNSSYARTNLGLSFMEHGEARAGRACSRRGPGLDEPRPGIRADLSLQSGDRSSRAGRLRAG